VVPEEVADQEGVQVKHWLPVVISLGLIRATWVGAQPTTLYDCVATGPDLTLCNDVATGTLLDACPEGPRIFGNYYGRVEWLLLYVGPIDVEVNARAVPSTHYPLYIEIVPQRSQTESPWCDLPGRVIMVARGGKTCDGWERVGPISLDYWVLPGERYVIRAHFFGSSGNEFASPYLGCVRVAPSFGAPSDVAERPWGLVKRLYH
jgi:hypothetical protein